MYKVYGSNMTRTFRVLWMLEEIGEAYEHIPTPPRSDVVVALNPSGKIPVMQADGETICDSTAILTFLADRHGKLTYRAGTPERAQQDSLTFAILDELDAIVWTAARHSFVLPEDQRVPAIKPSLAWEFARNLDRLANRCKGPFLMGDTMTIPDIIATHCLNWAFSAKMPLENEKMKTYGKAMRARDAFVRAQNAG